MNAPIFVIGYMASGKTTFGRALAREKGCRFIDLDFYIEQRFRRSVKEIFAERGEEGFRDLEQRMLREVGEFEDVVISCGGGTPCFCSNMDYMLERGLTVWLDTSEECILRRLKANNSRRPLMAGKSEDEMRRDMHAAMELRKPHYQRAKMHLGGDRLENRDEITDTISQFLKKLPINPD